MSCSLFEMYTNLRSNFPNPSSGHNNTGNVRITSHSDDFTKPLLPWKSNKYYVLVCVFSKRTHARVGNASLWVSVWVLGVCARELACVCARVALLIQHATRRPYCHLRPLWLHHMFRHLLKTARLSGKNCWTKNVFSFSLKLLFDTFLILRVIQRDIVINVKTSVCKVSVILVGFLKKLEFSQQIFQKSSNIKVHQNPSSGSQVVPCGQTDMMKLIVACRNFANLPKNWKFIQNIAQNWSHN